MPKPMNKRKFLGNLLCIYFLMSITGCSLSNHTQTPTTIMGIGDASYGGYAFLDKNDNGKDDNTDLPIKRAKLVLSIEQSMLSAITDEIGFAMIRFPVIARKQFKGKMWMEPPENSGYSLLDPEYVDVVCCTGNGNFLFK